MRSINATLKSTIATGSIDFIARLKIYISGVYYTQLDVLDYKLSGTELEVTAYGLIPASNTPDDVKVVLERGVRIAGYEYTLLTSKFSPDTGSAIIVDNVGIISTKVQAHIVPPKRITFAGDVSYQTAITSFCTAIGKTCSFKRPGDAYWGYQFLPAGRTYTANNAQAFLAFIHSKYFIYCCDNGSEELMFYHALAAPAVDAYLLPSIYKASVGYYQKRRYLARDENNTVRYGGGVNDQIHNLGFVKSTESLPTNYSQLQPVSFELPINLEYQDGDAFDVDAGNYYMFPAEIVEIFDPKHSPSWYLTVAQRMYFSATEGGALPSTIEASAPYTPLNTSKFDGALSAADNNIQAAFETLDDLNSREVLKASRTYYVRTDGNDGNDGFTNTAAGAFLTTQHAIDVVAALDISIYDVTIQHADGTYASAVDRVCKSALGTGKIIIKGNTGTPANVIFSSSSAINGFLINQGLTKYILQDCKLVGNAGAANECGIKAENGGDIEFKNIVFGANWDRHIFANLNGYISCFNPYTIAGSPATYHILIINGYVGIFAGTVTITGSPAWGAAFIYADTLSFGYSSGVTFSGACTGKRYIVDLNSVIQTWGGGANYFPGNVAGTTATGGQYA